MKITEAKKAKLVQSTGFGGYDVCVNPYVGCQFGCKYCYVQFFVKDDVKDKKKWGDFVRLRSFLEGKLPKEIGALRGQRLVIGTMTDPYQPQEKKARLTRKILQIIKEHGNPCKDIGIFTRSPFIKDDLDLLKELKVRVHLTITLFEQEILRKIEPIPIKMGTRFRLLKELVSTGINCHVSISPVLPILSDGLIERCAALIAAIYPNGFTVDPMQCYGPALKALDEALGDDIKWQECHSIVTDKKKYKEWKTKNKQAWAKTWAKYGNLDMLTIIMDHQEKQRYDLVTGKKIDFQDFTYQ